MRKRWRRMKGRNKVSSPTERWLVTTDLHICEAHSHLSQSDKSLQAHNFQEFSLQAGYCFDKLHCQSNAIFTAAVSFYCHAVAATFAEGDLHSSSSAVTVNVFFTFLPCLKIALSFC